MWGALDHLVLLKCAGDDFPRGDQLNSVFLTKLGETRIRSESRQTRTGGTRTDVADMPVTLGHELTRTGCTRPPARAARGEQNAYTCTEQTTVAACSGVV